jgi:alpha-D-xyloside xylohydrolase
MEVPRERVPVFVRSGAAIPVYPIPVSCTDEIDLEKAEDVVFDGSYRGFGNSLLGRVTGGIIR